MTDLRNAKVNDKTLLSVPITDFAVDIGFWDSILSNKSFHTSAVSIEKSIESMSITNGWKEERHITFLGLR